MRDRWLWVLLVALHVPAMAGLVFVLTSSKVMSFWGAMLAGGVFSAAVFFLVRGYLRR